MRLVHGFGVNDANYVVGRSVNGKRVVCKAYHTWCGIISACYSEKSQKDHQSQTGVTVCDEWRSFMAFREWWLGNYIDGWRINRKLLTENSQYSPDSCLYVPAWLGLFTTGSDSDRGKYGVGVGYDKNLGLFMARGRNALNGKLVTIGRFKTPEAAHLAWRARKLEYAAQMKSEMDAIDARIYPRVVEIINRAK